MRVVITRPEPDAAAFAAQCRKAGLEPVICPLMDVVFSGAEPPLADIAALAFTSANGVRAFADTGRSREMPVYTVGGATAEAAREAGFSKVEAAGGDAQSLAALIAQDRLTITGPILHIAGKHRAGDLTKRLADAGIEARRVVLYEAVEAASLPDAAIHAFEDSLTVDWVALFSPRSAALFLRLAAASQIDLGATAAACLSSAVAEAARGPAWRRVAVADTRTASALIALMKNIA